MAAALHVVVAKFPYAFQAEHAIQGIKEKGVKLADHAVLEMDAKGKLKIHESKDAGGGKGFVAGAVATGVLEVIAGPVGWTMLAGGVAGGLVAKFHDAGVPTKRLEELGARLEKGQGAAVAIAKDGDETLVAEVLKNYGGEVVSVAVTDSLKKALEASAPGDAVPA